jgi:hypothetical protein
MKRFVILYHAPVSAAQQMASATPEQMKAGMDAMAWAKKAGSAIVDLGAPLGNAKMVKRSAVTASGTMVTGYSISSITFDRHCSRVAEGSSPPSYVGVLNRNS